MKTTEEIYQSLLAAFAQRAGFTPEADCDLAVRLYAAAAELQALDIQGEWVLDQSFPQTAQGIYLDYHGQMRGISRLPATKARGTIRFSVSYAAASDLTISGGTVCMTPDETRFQTTEDVVLKAGPREPFGFSRPARWALPGARTLRPLPAAVTRRMTRACGSGFWRATSGCPTAPMPPGMNRRP